jgi:hypothetical protein
MAQQQTLAASCVDIYEKQKSDPQDGLRLRLSTRFALVPGKPGSGVNNQVGGIALPERDSSLAECAHVLHLCEHHANYF